LVAERRRAAGSPLDGQPTVLPQMHAPNEVRDLRVTMPVEVLGCCRGPRPAGAGEHDGRLELAHAPYALAERHVHGPWHPPVRVLPRFAHVYHLGAAFAPRRQVLGHYLGMHPTTVCGAAA